MCDIKEKMHIAAAARARAIEIYDKPDHKIVGDYPTATVTSIKDGVARGYITLLFENAESVCKSYFIAEKQNDTYIIRITSDFND